MLIQCFDTPEVQLVALHPQDMLPHGKILLRRNSNGYRASSDGLLRQVDPVSILSLDPPAPDAPPFPPFIHETKRRINQAINVYFLLLNADIKFRRFMQSIGLDKLHPEMRAIAKQTMDIADLMYTQLARSESCTAVAAAARGEYSLLPHPQDAGLDYSERNIESTMEGGGGAGPSGGRNPTRLLPGMVGYEREPHMVASFVGTAWTSLICAQHPLVGTTYRMRSERRLGVISSPEAVASGLCSFYLSYKKLIDHWIPIKT